MSVGLKPCPFCGGEAEVCIEEHTWPPVRVRCPECGMATHWEITKIEAVKAWNTRVIDCDRCQFDAVPATDENMAKRGWVRERTCHNDSYRLDTSRFKCSECGKGGWWKDVADGQDKVPSFCPNCGARVVEE